MKDTRDVVGLNVFSVKEGRILGKAIECVVDLSTGKVLGLIVETDLKHEMGIARGDITAVGRDAVMVDDTSALQPLTAIEDLAELRTSGGKAAPRVVTRSGVRLGALGVVRVDDACKTVESYEIVGDVMQAIADGPASLPIIKGTVHGRDALVLPDEAVEAIKRPGGLRAWLEKSVDAVKDAATEVSERVTTGAKKVRTMAEAAEEKATKGAKAARDAVEQRIHSKQPAKKAPAKKAAQKKAPPTKAAKKKATRKKAPAKKKAAKKKAAKKK